MSAGAPTTGVAGAAGVLTWTPLTPGTMPAPHRLLLVTNHIDARIPQGEMSHVWMVDMVHHGRPEGDFGLGWRRLDQEQYYAYGAAGLILGLTHWRYAVPTAAEVEESVKAGLGQGGMP